MFMSDRKIRFTSDVQVVLTLPDTCTILINVFVTAELTSLPGAITVPWHTCNQRLCSLRLNLRCCRTPGPTASWHRHYRKKQHGVVSSYSLNAPFQMMHADGSNGSFDCPSRCNVTPHTLSADKN